MTIMPASLFFKEDTKSIEPNGLERGLRRHTALVQPFPRGYFMCDLGRVS